MTFKWQPRGQIPLLVTAQRPNSPFPLDLTGTWPGVCQFLLNSDSCNTSGSDDITLWAPNGIHNASFLLLFRWVKSESQETCDQDVCFPAETWFSLLFTVLVEIVPVSIRSISIGTFLFLMNNVGGNLPLLVDPLSKIPGVGLQTALYISWPGLTAISESDWQRWTLGW